MNNKICSLDDKLSIIEQNKIYEDLEEFQKLVLDGMSKINNFPFVFTGGTALTKVYLDNHRRSYDLDYFGNFKIYKNFQKDVTNVFKDIDVKIEDFRSDTDQEGTRFDKYIVSKTINNSLVTMKVEFVEDCFNGLFKPSYNNGWITDSLEAIYFRKIYALLSRDFNRIKDLIDLYYLHEIQSFEEYYSTKFLSKFKEYFIQKGHINLEFNSKELIDSINSFLKYIFTHENEVNALLHSYDSRLNYMEIHERFSGFYNKLSYNEE